MDFVHKVDCAVVLAEFVFSIYKDQSAFCCDFSSAFEESQRIFFENFVFFGSSQSLFQDFFFRDVFVMKSHFCFRRRGNDRFREFLVLAHSVR